MPSAIKEIMLNEIKKEFEENSYAFISGFDGLTVSDMSDLRQNLSKSAKRSIVVKHSLAKKVFGEMKLQDAEKFLKGQILVTVGSGEPQAVSKTIVEFAKKNKKLAPVGVVFENKVYDSSYIKSLALLPSRQELLTQVVVRVKSPISGLVMTLGQLVRGFVVALNEVKKKKEDTLKKMTDPFDDP